MNTLNHFMQTESVEHIKETLAFLLYECSLEDAPTHKEVQNWANLLQQRGKKYAHLATMCINWLEEEKEHHETHSHQ